MESYTFTAIVFLIFLIAAWAIWHYGHKYGSQAGWTRKGINRLTAGIVLLAILFATYTFIVDYNMRVTTLYEEVLEGSIGLQEGAPAPVRTITF